MINHLNMDYNNRKLLYKSIIRMENLIYRRNRRRFIRMRIRNKRINNKRR